jgi:hypothetical protein
MSFTNTNYLPYYYTDNSNLFTTSLGIGTNSTSYELDVAGDINFTGSLYQNGTQFVSGGGGGGGSSVWTSNSSDIYYLSGSVGIGTTNPEATLHILSSNDIAFLIQNDGNNLVSSYYEITTNEETINYTQSIPSNSDVILPVSTDHTAIFNVKYNLYGNPQFANVFYNPNAGSFDTANAVDSNGNTYITFFVGISGSYISVTDYDGGTRNNVQLATSTNPGTYLIKYDNVGIALWAVKIDSGGWDYPGDLAVDSADNIYITGMYSTAITLYDAAGTRTNLVSLPSATSGTYGAYIIKYNTSGVVLWAIKIDGGASQRGFALKVDTNDSVYIAGVMNANNSITAYNPGNVSSGYTVSSYSTSGGFLAKYNSTGTAQWIVRILNSTPENFQITCDTDNNIYITTSYNSASGSSIYDKNNAVSSVVPALPSNSVNNIAIVKYNTDGFAVWATSINTDSYNGGIEFDGVGNIYLTGGYSSSSSVIVYDANGTNYLNNVTIPSTSSISSSLLVKYNTNGIAQWAAYTIGDNSSGLSDVTIYNNSNIIVGGQYYTTSIPLQIYDYDNSQRSNISLPLTNTAEVRACMMINYNSDGIAQWGINTIEGNIITTNNRVRRIQSDNDGNIYLSGEYRTSVPLVIPNTTTTFYLSSNIQITTSNLIINDNSIYTDCQTIIQNNSYGEASLIIESKDNTDNTIIGWKINNNSNTNDFSISYNSNYGNNYIDNWTNYLTIGKDGNIGISTTNPLNTLDINGNVNFTGTLYQNGTEFILSDDIWSNNGTNIYHYGFVGIGTNNPSVPLEISSSADYDPNNVLTSIYSLGYNPSTYNPSTAQYTSASDINYITSSTSIFTNKSIGTTKYVYSTLGTLGASDSRIKTNITDIDDGAALQTIRNLKPKKYNYIDTIKHGSEPVWGFIAQEVKDTLPYATQLKHDYIPNIYSLANVNSNVLTFTNFNTSNLEIDNTKIKIITINGVNKYITLQTIIDEHSFSINETIDTSDIDTNNNIFIYGQYIDDFVLLKKEAIFTVATAALQELDRDNIIAIQNISDIEERIQLLESKINTLLSSNIN